MTRILLHYVLPFLAPTLCYLLWAWWAGRRARARGESAPDGGGADGGAGAVIKGPWLWLMAAGAVLVMASLSYVALTSGAPPDAGDYRAPRLEDGKIVPPSYE